MVIKWNLGSPKENGYVVGPMSKTAQAAKYKAINIFHHKIIIALTCTKV